MLDIELFHNPVVDIKMPLALSRVSPFLLKELTAAVLNEVAVRAKFQLGGVKIILITFSWVFFWRWKFLKSLKKKFLPFFVVQVKNVALGSLPALEIFFYEEN